ncbi:hypothetical protein CTRI78_v001502 [Colletotrichum trifolii]|uniref:Zinc finger PHD-type domain-containing protein n=1 Tax=Colletotrichum trifolii TaxID=5466 RepID=A0A4R8RPC4_COLTR|nr:hypothetical protein CTRI78_v001502 [Colletotrichum trifolii]
MEEANNNTATAPKWEPEQAARQAQDGPTTGSFVKTEDAPSTSTPLTSAPPSKYVPQFSAATQLLLSRLKKGVRSGSPSPLRFPSPQPPPIVPDAAELQRINKMKTTLTLSLPTPSTKASASRSPARTSASTPTTAGESSSGQRKRRLTHDEASSSHPSQAQNARAAELQASVGPAPKPPSKRRRLQDDTMCISCQRASFTDNNRLVVCVCGEAWHQLCHDPAIPAEAVGRRAGFKCRTCLREQQAQQKYEMEQARYREAKQRYLNARKRQNDVAKMRERNLANMPEFPRPEIVGFTAGDASLEARYDYFAQLKKNQLLNLLSFCDEIEDGLLVDVLVSVTKKQPHLPIFGSPDWADPVSDIAPEGPEAPPSGPAPRKPAKQRSKKGGVRHTLKTHHPDAPGAGEDEDEDDEDDSAKAKLLPSTWAKAGQGLYALLTPEHDDPLLVEDNEEAFSHFMVGANGRQI